MKVKAIINSEEINTDKMTDVEAEIFEKQHELCLLCQKYDIPFYGVMFGAKPLFSQHFFIENQTSSKEVNKRVSKFLKIINSHILRLTGSQFAVFPTTLKKQEQEDDYNEGEDRNIGENWKNE